jgi:hypothetical protein
MSTEQRAREALAILERIRDDRSWRTNDNALWPDILATITSLRSALSQPASAGEGFVVVAVPPANCRQRLSHEGKPYPRSSCAVCGKLSPNWRQCDAALHGIAAAAPTPPAAAQEDARDAARYVFLRDNWPNVCTATGIAANGKFGVTEIFLGTINYPEFDTSTLDAAIDAAMLTSPDSGKVGG